MLQSFGYLFVYRHVFSYFSSTTALVMLYVRVTCTLRFNSQTTMGPLYLLGTQVTSKLNGERQHLSSESRAGKPGF